METNIRMDALINSYHCQNKQFVWAHWLCWLDSNKCIYKTSRDFMNYEMQNISSSVMSDSSQSHWLQPARLLCPWNSPGKNTGVGSHSIFQRIFSTQGSMIIKSRQNLMCTFYWHKGMLLLLIRSMDFSMTLLCLSIIFSQCSRPSPDLNSRETSLQRLTYSGFLTA